MLTLLILGAAAFFIYKKSFVSGDKVYEKKASSSKNEEGDSSHNLPIKFFK